MLNNKIRYLLGVSFLALAGVFVANAQIEHGSAIRFSVSHPFVVKDKTFPAGNYSISAVDMPDGSTDLLRLQSLDGKESMLLSTVDKFYETRAKGTQIIFDQVGNEYFLTGIRTKGDDVGLEVLGSKAEKRALAEAGMN
jgi:hypothetical protein